MSDDWQFVRLGDIAEITSSKRVKMSDYVQSGIPFFRSKEIIERFKGNQISTKLFISNAQFNEIRSKFGVPEAGDILLTSVGTLGVPYQVSESDTFYFKDGNLTWFRKFKEGINPRYLYYWLTSPEAKRKFSEVTIGSTQQALTIMALKTINIQMPPLDYQNKIAMVMDSLSQKLLLNRQTNQTLEQMAQALFKSWFVDFDPVIDNALDSGFFEREFEGEGIPEPLAQRAAVRQAMRQSLREAGGTDTAAPVIGGLPSETRALFPDSFEEHPELGWIPKGWEVKPVSEALDINPKVKLSKGTTAKFADMKAAPTSGYMIDGVIEKEFSGGSKFMADDVLLARITPCLENGKTAIVDFLAQDEAGFGSTEFIVMRGKGAVSMPFVACLSRLPEFRAHCIQSMVGSSGRQRVQNACFDSFYLTFPPTADVLEKFEQTCLPSFRQMTVARLESEALANLRDTLLPKLLSGELELANTEIIVEAFA
ncbi:restriction endonuclease subunit S [Shewanella chilikensis]|uniref:restriction endonuclease subunit S n=1 Tax=Shewanella chilikensis TaxID=558541 RepID=UPI0030051027